MKKKAKIKRKRKAGGGRKGKYNEPSAILTIRVPKSKLQECKALITNHLKTL